MDFKDLLPGEEEKSFFNGEKKEEKKERFDNNYYPVLMANPKSAGRDARNVLDSDACVFLTEMINDSRNENQSVEFIVSSSLRQTAKAIIK